MRRGDVTSAWLVAVAAAPEGWDVGLQRHDGAFEAWANPSGDMRSLEGWGETPEQALIALAATLLELKPSVESNDE